MKFHLEDMAILSREVTATFTFIIAALSVAFGYLLNVYEPRADMRFQRWVWLAPTAAINLQLLFCASWLLIKAMGARRVEPLGNEPKNLLSEEALKADAEEVRLSECRNQQARIEFNRSRNAFTAAELNRVRRWLLTVPLTFVVVWAAMAVSKALGWLA